MTLWIGIDPSTTKCGVAWLGEKEVYTLTFEHDDKDPVKRMVTLMKKLKQEMFIAYYFDNDVRIFCEEPYLPGHGHDTLNRLLGMIQYEFYNKERKVHMIHPMSLKKYFGSGKLSKIGLARKIKMKMPLASMRKYVQKLIKEERWDETDALAIAIYGKEINEE